MIEIFGTPEDGERAFGNKYHEKSLPVSAPDDELLTEEEIKSFVRVQHMGDENLPFEEWNIEGLLEAQLTKSHHIGQEGIAQDKLVKSAQDAIVQSWEDEKKQAVASAVKAERERIFKKIEKHKLFDMLKTGAHFPLKDMSWWRSLKGEVEPSKEVKG